MVEKKKWSVCVRERETDRPTEMNSTTSSITTTTITTTTTGNVGIVCAWRAMFVCVYRSSGVDEGKEREKPSTTTTTTVVRRCHFGILIRDGRFYYTKTPHAHCYYIIIIIIIYNNTLLPTPSTTFLLGYSPTTIINLERERRLILLYMCKTCLK